MAVHRKNLLEAFRDAGNTPAQQPEPSAGPFAQSVTPAPAKSPPLPREPREPRGGLPAWLPWVCGVAMAFVFGLAIGRKSASLAASPERPADESEPADTASAPAPPRSDSELTTRPADSAPAAAQPPAALRDQANRFTIVVATYGLSRQDFAFATHDQLADQGFQVWPVAQRGDNYIVLVGAAPESKDLEATLRRLTRLESWDKTPEAYADAYVERIDRIIDR